MSLEPADMKSTENDAHILPSVAPVPESEPESDPSIFSLLPKELQNESFETLIFLDELKDLPDNPWRQKPATESDRTSNVPKADSLERFVIMCSEDSRMKNSKEFQQLLNAIAQVCEKPSLEICKILGNEKLEEERRKDAVFHVCKNHLFTGLTNGRTGYTKVMSFFLSIPVEIASRTNLASDLYELVFRYRLHATRVLDVALCVLEFYMTSAKYHVPLLQFLEGQVRDLTLSLKHVLARRMSHEPSWRRLMVLAHLTSIGLLSLQDAWNLVNAVTSANWVANAKKYRDDRHRAARLRKMYVPLDTAKRGQLTDAPQEKVVIPECMKLNPAIEFVAALIRTGSFDSAVQLLKQYSECDFFAYSPSIAYRSVVVCALRAITEHFETVQIDFLAQVGHHLGEDMHLLCRLSSADRFRNNDIFIQKCLIPSVIVLGAVPAMLSAAIRTYFRLDTDGCTFSPEVVAARVKQNEIVTYCQKRTTLEESLVFAQKIGPILHSYPFAVIDRIIEQAVGYDDTRLMTAQAQLLQFAPDAAITLTLNIIHERAVELEAQKSLLSTPELSSLAALFSILWRQNFDKVDLERVLTKLLYNSSNLVFIYFWRGILENVMFLPMFSDAALNAKQKKTLACGFMTMWLTGGGYDRFCFTVQSLDPKLTLSKFLSYMETLLSEMNKVRSYIEIRFLKIRESFFSDFADAQDCVVGTGLDLLAEVQKRYDVCCDVVAHLCPWLNQKNFASAITNQRPFWFYTLSHLEYTEALYDEALEITSSLDVSSTAAISGLQQTIHDEQSAHQKKYQYCQHAFLSDFTGQSFVSYSEILTRVRTSPAEAIYCAKYMALKTNQRFVEGAVSLILNFVPGFTQAESSYIGTSIYELLLSPSFSDNLGTHAQLCRTLIAGLGSNSEETTKHNVLSILNSLQPLFPIHSTTAEALLVVLNHLLTSNENSSLHPQVIKLKKQISERKCIEEDDAALHVLVHGSVLTLRSSRDRKLAQH